MKRRMINQKERDVRREVKENKEKASISHSTGFNKDKETHLGVPPVPRDSQNMDSIGNSSDVANHENQNFSEILALV